MAILPCLGVFQGEHLNLSSEIPDHQLCGDPGWTMRNTSKPSVSLHLVNKADTKSAHKLGVNQEIGQRPGEPEMILSCVWATGNSNEA